MLSDLSVMVHGSTNMSRHTPQVKDSSFAGAVAICLHIEIVE